MYIASIGVAGEEGWGCLSPKSEKNVEKKAKVPLPPPEKDTKYAVNITTLLQIFNFFPSFEGLTQEPNILDIFGYNVLKILSYEGNK